MLIIQSKQHKINNTKSLLVIIVKTQYHVIYAFQTVIP